MHRALRSSIAERGRTACLHYEDMLSHHGIQRGLRMARKHLGWYAAGLKQAASFRAAVNHENDPTRVMTLTRHFFDTGEAEFQPEEVAA